MENIGSSSIPKRDFARIVIKTGLPKPALKIGMMPNLRLIAMKGKATGDCVNEKFTLLKKLIHYHFKQHDRLTLFLQFSLINCTSSKHLYDIVRLLNKYQKNNKRTLIHWDCKESDEEMLDTAIDFRGLSDCTFEINLR